MLVVLAAQAFGVAASISSAGILRFPRDVDSANESSWASSARTRLLAAVF